MRRYLENTETRSLKLGPVLTRHATRETHTLRALNVVGQYGRWGCLSTRAREEQGRGQDLEGDVEVGQVLGGPQQGHD